MNGTGDRDPRVGLGGEGWIQFFHIVGFVTLGVAVIVLVTGFLTEAGPLVLAGGGWVLSGIIIIGLASVFKGIYQWQELALDQQARVIADLDKIKDSLLGDEDSNRERAGPAATKTRCPACRFEMDDPLGNRTECPSCGRLLNQ